MDTTAIHYLVKRSYHDMDKSGIMACLHDQAHLLEALLSPATQRDETWVKLKDLTWNECFWVFLCLRELKNSTRNSMNVTVNGLLSSTWCMSTERWKSHVCRFFKFAIWQHAARKRKNLSDTKIDLPSLRIWPSVWCYLNRKICQMSTQFQKQKEAKLKCHCNSLTSATK